MFAGRKLIATVTATGLALSVATGAASAPAKQGASHDNDRTSARAERELDVLNRPSHHFRATLAVAKRRAERQDRESGAPSGGSFPSPESVGVSSGTLESVAACESGGDPTAVSADGTYHGKYQFDTGTWASVGGSGDPAAAPEEEQDYRAALLYSRSGSNPWPICGG